MRNLGHSFSANELPVDIISTSTMPPHVSANSSVELVDQPVPTSPTSTDGWGELEKGINEEHDSDGEQWDAVESFEEPKPSPDLANIQAAQRRPVSQPKPSVSHSKIPVSNSRSRSTTKLPKNDDEEDLWGSIAAPAPAPVATPMPNNLGTQRANEDDDLWAAIAAPPPTTTARPLSVGKGRGRGARPAAQKLGAQRINRTSGM